MKKLKRYICIMLIIALLFCLFGCSPGNDETEVAENEVTELLQANQNAFSEITSSKALSNYIFKWGSKIEGLRLSIDDYNNVIISKKASDGYKDADSTILYCTLDVSEEKIDHTLLSVTALMYILENIENHGFIRVIFAQQDGLDNIKRLYLTGTNFISLDYQIGNSLLVGSAGIEKYDVFRSISYIKASYPHQYRLEINGINPEECENTNQVNAIKVLGKLLAQCKSDGILFELAAFEGGSENSFSQIPDSAYATVLINQNDINKFTKRVNKSIASTLDKYQEKNPDLSYTITEIEGIEKVISSEDSSSIISFIYTLPIGINAKSDDGEKIAVSGIGNLYNTGNTINISLCVKSKSQAILEDLNNTMETLCGLYDMNYNMKEIMPVWDMMGEDISSIEAESSTLKELIANMPSRLIPALSSSMEDCFGKTPKYKRIFETNSCQIANKLNPKLLIVGYGISENDLTEEIEALIQFLYDLSPDEQKEI